MLSLEFQVLRRRYASSNAEMPAGPSFEWRSICLSLHVVQFCVGWFFIGAALSADQADSPPSTTSSVPVT